MPNPEREITPGQMFTPETTAALDSSQTPNPDIPRGRKSLSRFYQDFQAFGRKEVLDERRARLLEAFIAPPGPTLNDLRNEAGVTTRERVRQLLESAISKAWETLPPTLQNQYLLPDLTHLGHSPETRARMNRANKGRTHSLETRAKMSQAHKDQWQDKDYRAKMSQAQRKRRQREKQAPST